MNKKEILKIANQNNGYISKQVMREHKIDTIYLIRLVKAGELVKVARGIYLLKDRIEDPYYIYSLTYSNLVFSNETALYLNGLSNKGFPGFDVTFPSGSFYPSIAGVKGHKKVEKIYNVGIALIETPFGNKVKCYNKERCICDLFINKEYDYEDRIYAINLYKEKYLDFEKLYKYAKELGVYEKVSNVFEVIGWN